MLELDLDPAVAVERDRIMLATEGFEDRNPGSVDPARAKGRAPTAGRRPLVQLARDPCLVVPALFGDLGEERVFTPPAPPRSRSPPFPGFDLAGLPDHARHESSRAVGGEVLLDLDRDYLGRVHLAVEELNDSAQFTRNRVADEDHPHLPGAQVVARALPPLLDVDVISGDVLRNLVGFAVVALALAHEQLSQ